MLFFFFNDTATTEIYTLSLHDALPICSWHDTSSATRRAARRPARWTTRSDACRGSPASDCSRRGCSGTREPPTAMEDAMATVTTEHYRAYTPRPFTRQERDSVTILFGGLHWRAERGLQAVLEGSGYRARVLPIATREDLLTGREVADIGQCCPTSFTTGNLVNFLKGEAG